MVAKTSAFNDFNLSLVEMAEEAWERCGAEMRSGYDMRTTRRSLNLLLADWANRGINMWTIDTGTIPLVQGTATYDLPIDTVDLVEQVVRTGTGINQQDLTIPRISVDTYATIPNKLTQGRPIQVYIDRQSGATNSASVVQNPTITVWPVPDGSTTYTFAYWRLRRMQNAGDGINGQDIPFRFMPAMTSGLAYYLSLKVPGAAERTQMLKGIYDEDWLIAAEEDREKATASFTPWIPNIY